PLARGEAVGPVQQQALAEDAGRAAAGRRAAPDDHGVALGVHGDRGVLLVAGRRVDAELGADGRPGGVELLAEGALAAAVRVVASPGHQEVAAAVHRHAGGLHVARSARVHPDFGALRHALHVVALGVDAPAGAALPVALPDDDEVPGVAVHGDCGGHLVAGGI